MPTYQYLNDKQEVIAEVRAYDIADADILFKEKYGVKYGNPDELQWKIKPEPKEDSKILGNVVQVAGKPMLEFEKIDGAKDVVTGNLMYRATAKHSEGTYTIFERRVLQAMTGDNMEFDYVFEAVFDYNADYKEYNLGLFGTLRLAKQACSLHAHAMST